MTKDGTRTSHYDFDLPADRIAQQPPPRRGDSRLMVVNRSTGEISHKQFSDLEQLIPAGDAIVLNTTRVFRARLLGVRENGTPAEVLLLRPLDEGTWEAMVHPGGKLKPGRIVHVADDFEVEIVSTTERRTRVVSLKSSLPVDQAIEKYGHVPLPPYITRADQPADAERYQTVYAAESGSVAAPTAGLHFTPEILDALSANGVKRADLLLHVGAGTFKPVEDRASRRSRHARGVVRAPRAHRGDSERNADEWRKDLGGRNHERAHAGERDRRRWNLSARNRATRGFSSGRLMSSAPSTG